VSIFVNPLQFAPNEDFERYPRDEERDTRMAEEAGADLLFLPETGELVPPSIRTKVTVAELTDRLCGLSRPGHFDGVATIVTKLFNIILPDKAYFGLKDAQQAAVVEQMAKDLNMPVEIVPCPTVREADGLAKSSRNVYLSAAERAQAAVLPQALQRAEQWKDQPGMTVGKLRDLVKNHILSAPLANIDYVEVLTYPGLGELADNQPVNAIEGRWIIALAVKFGGTRLIDNTIFGGETLV
jgi:pantoate--beta-alanine ligase